MEHRTYRIFGYQGTQVRDAIHSHDLVTAFEAFFRAPRQGEIYNMGGGRHSHTSLTEAVALAEKITGEPMVADYQEANRIGDHIWWVAPGTAEELLPHHVIAVLTLGELATEEPGDLLAGRPRRTHGTRNACGSRPVALFRASF